MKHFQEWAPFRYNPRYYQAQDLKDAVNRIRPQGGAAIVALFDPVGMAAELAARINYLLERRLEQSEQDTVGARKMRVASTVLQLRQAVHTQAENDRLDRAVSDHAIGTAVTGPAALFDTRLRADLDQTLQPTGAQLDQARAAAWRRYTHRTSGAARFDEAGAEALHRKVTQDTEQYARDTLEPLGDNHVAWVTSTRMQNYLAENFDPHNPKTNVAYVETVLSFTTGTEGVRPCFLQYERWLRDGRFAPDNLLLRAFFYNNPTLMRQVQDASSLDPRAIPWDVLQSTFKLATENLSQPQVDRVAVLLAQMMGPLMRVSDVVLTGSLRALAILMGLLSGRPLVSYALTGTREQVRRWMTRMTLDMQSGKLNRAQIQVVLDREIRLARARGEKLNGKQTVQWVALLQPAGSRPPGSLEDLRVEQWRGMLTTEMRLGVCVALLQYWCLTKAMTDYGKALEVDQPEAASRLAAGVMGLTGTVAETLGVTIRNAAEANMPWAQGLGGIRTARFLIVGGRTLGLMGGAIMAAWDFVKGWGEYKKGSHTTAGLYATSGFFGITVAASLGFFGFNPFTLLLVAVFIGVVYLLEIYKDNPVQTWLENCIFGINNYYTDGRKEMDELRRALS